MPRATLVSLVLCMLLPAGPLAAGTVGGHTAGQFQVTESGAAAYTVPITVVLGTSGIFARHRPPSSRPSTAGRKTSYVEKRTPAACSRLFGVQSPE